MAANINLTVGHGYCAEFFNLAHQTSLLERNLIIPNFNHGILVAPYAQNGVVAITAMIT